MITLGIEIISYDRDLNVCKARLDSGDVVTVDPFVYGAIPMPSMDYDEVLGSTLLGKSFMLCGPS
jgi:hypothetical protein